jgi:anaerobic selenocysteine-containing dehydrogenase
VVSHGYGTTLPDPVRRLREHRAAGGRTWVLDPRRTETAAQADHHLAVRPGSDVEVLAWLAASVLDDGADTEELDRWCDAIDVRDLRAALAPFTLERAASAAGVDHAELQDLLADIRRSGGRLAAFCGTGTTMARDGVLVDWLRWVLLIATGSLDRPGGMRFNRGAVNRLRPWRGEPPTAPGPASRPDLGRVAGQVPAVALADEIEAGNLEVLVVTGGSPLSAFPEPDRLRAALGRLRALAVVDVAEGELTGLATHILPATGQLERADLSLAEHVALRSGIQFTSAVVPAGGRRRPTWWILASLGRRVGVDLLAGADPDQLDDEAFLAGLLGAGPLDAAEVVAHGPHGTDVAVEHGWVHAEMLPEGRWRIAPPVLLDRLAARSEPPPDTVGGLVLVPRREGAWSNSVRYAGRDDGPELRLHPDDAAARGLVSGAGVRVTSAHGATSARLAVDPGLRPGTASMTHGRPGANTGRLTSATRDVDPLTGMPLASGVAVEVAPAP